MGRDKALAFLVQESPIALLFRIKASFRELNTRLEAAPQFEARLEICFTNFICIEIAMEEVDAWFGSTYPDLGRRKQRHVAARESVLFTPVLQDYQIYRKCSSPESSAGIWAM